MISLMLLIKNNWGHWKERRINKEGHRWGLCVRHWGHHYATTVGMESHVVCACLTRDFQSKLSVQTWVRDSGETVGGRSKSSNSFWRYVTSIWTLRNLKLCALLAKRQLITQNAPEWLKLKTIHEKLETTNIRALGSDDATMTTTQTMTY